MRPIILAITFFLCFRAYSNNIEYSVSSIPEKLMQGANVVKRIEEMRIEVSSGKIVSYHKYALTILNESGDKYAVAAAGYDKFVSVSLFEGVLFDKFGKEIKKLKPKDIQDFSSISEISLFEDSRMKVHSFYHKLYPYTIEYEIETKVSNTYFLPSWRPQNFEHLAVQKSRLIVISPESYSVRYKEFNFKAEPNTSLEKGKKTMKWEIENQPAITKSFASPRWHELTTAVYLAPSEFKMQDYKGSAVSWEELGKFQLELNKGRDQLPENVLQKVRELTTNVNSSIEKVKALYHFLQQNTRYISIQLGIGGWQPFEASYVAQKGYGDCKALSNYMYSLLKAAGIESYYTCVKGGRDQDAKYIIEDFPSDQFNHIILCVPLEKDTVWLECTSQTDPAGYMGSFTGNRKALLITEMGGKLVSTPRYGVKENLQIRSVKGIIKKDGSLDVKVNTHYTGMQQDDLHGLLNALSKDKVKKVLNERLDLSTYDVMSFNYEQHKAQVPQIDEQLDISVSNYATVSGKRLFIYPNLLNRNGTRIPDEERTYDFVFDFEYRDVDSIEFDLPEGYELEAIPKDVSLKTKYGIYTSSVKFENNKLYYLRIREQYAGKFSAKEKEELAAYFETIYKTDRGRVVLVKK